MTSDQPAGARAPGALPRGERRQRGWIDGNLGHAVAYQFEGRESYMMEVYYEKYRAPEILRPALRNQPQKYSAQGVGVRRLDHVNVLR